MSHPSKSRSYRKYVIIAVTGIVMAAIILTAILVGMHFLTEAQKEIVKVAKDNELSFTDLYVMHINVINQSIVSFPLQLKTSEFYISAEWSSDCGLIFRLLCPSPQAFHSKLKSSLQKLLP